MDSTPAWAAFRESETCSGYPTLWENRSDFDRLESRSGMEAYPAELEQMVLGALHLHLPQE